MKRITKTSPVSIGRGFYNTHNQLFMVYLIPPHRIVNLHTGLLHIADNSNHICVGCIGSNTA